MVYNNNNYDNDGKTYQSKTKFLFRNGQVPQPCKSLRLDHSPAMNIQQALDNSIDIPLIQLIQKASNLLRLIGLVGTDDNAWCKQDRKAKRWPQIWVHNLLLKQIRNREACAL
jgi:hypothetical protein